ncbi:MAG: winged helix DNA-binding domain-containing protein [Chloroflexi bacterium]|nr:winged helix DNA-binding domain-containing protein [Chloroflexota bacterium]
MTAGPILTSADLNRAMLARQHLLAPTSLGIVAAIEAIGGLQAQEPASPYVALWSRLANFEAAELDRAFVDQSVVKATLMRVTLHAVSATDYGQLLPAVRPMHHALRRRGAAAVDDAIVARLGRSALAHAAEPRSNPALRAHVEAEAGRLGVDLDEVWWWVRLRHDFIHVPTTRPWSFSRRPILTAASAWLDAAVFADEPEAIEHLVRRYLGAFGPATLADAAGWSGLSATALRPGLAAIEGAGEVWHGRDEAGRLLVDLAQAPRPGGDVEAPPRLLPMWDSILLAHRDRTRLMDDATRSFVIGRNGDTLPAFLVDGRVAGLWWAVGDDGGGRCRIELEPFGRLAPGAMPELAREAERLAAFLEPLDPNVYRRYRRSRARRRPGA